jgi:very-short-patch-repair endonuclease
LGSWSARANEGSERVGPSCACMPRREKVAPAEPREVGDEGGCHAFLAWRGVHAHDGPTLFSITSFARDALAVLVRQAAWRSREEAACAVAVHLRIERALARSIQGSTERRSRDVEFFVPAYKLVVEVDGAVHDGAEARARDAWRDAELGRMYGVRVLRIDAELVERDVYAAMAIVRAAL